MSESVSVAGGELESGTREPSSSKGDDGFLLESRMSDYDRACKAAARGVDVEGFLRWATPPSLATVYTFTGWLNTETITMPGQPDRRCDTVAGFRHRAGMKPPLALIIEFSTVPRTETLARLAEYSLRVHREVPLQRDPLVPYRVLCVLLNLTGPKQSGLWEMEDDEMTGLTLRIEARVLTLREEDATATVEAVLRGDLSRAVLPFVPLMRGADDRDLVGRWRTAGESEQDRERRGSLGFLASSFLPLVPHRSVWVEGLKGWNMEESPYWAEIRQGGRVEQTQRLLVQLMQTRLGATIAAELSPRVAQMTDLPTLERCVLLADPSSIDQLRTLLSSPG
jgi:hypothetical protein